MTETNATRAAGSSEPACSAYVFTLTMAFDTQKDGANVLGAMQDRLEYGPHTLAVQGRPATAEEIVQMQGRRDFWRALHPEPWWCPYCLAGVLPEHVTSDERHDERNGGCGCAVVPNSVISLNGAKP
jgi:hypothetical protein